MQVDYSLVLLYVPSYVLVFVYPRVRAFALPFVRQPIAKHINVKFVHIYLQSSKMPISTMVE